MTSITSRESRKSQFPKLYTRIRDTDGFVGTVLYAGTVASSKNRTEVYAGIVWDDNSRGKHDGSVICRQTNQIVRHFSCGPTQGSFLRIRKLDFGVALTTTLLRDKYVKMNAPIIAPNNLLPHSAKTSSGREKSIEFLGELQIRKHQQLENIVKVSLRREGISNISDDDEDMVEFQHIKDIDLAGNLLCDWEQVFKIIHKFPCLETFSLAHNYIRNIDKVVHVQFDKMKILNLNNCSIQSFETVSRLGEMMPNLESLCIANSNFSDIEKYEINGFQNLRQLDCSRCGFDLWQNQVNKFATLPLLESLSIDENPIPCIPTDAGIQPLFPSLISLQISRTAVSTWLDLEGINSFVSLKGLRFKSVPLTENLGQGEVRSISIARFPYIDYLNASRISQKERIEAERRYVTLVSHLLKKNNILDENENEQRIDSACSNRIKIMKENPRYLELAEKHKNLVIFSKNGMEKNGNLATSIYNITIKSMLASSCTMDPIVRRLPGTLNVLRMKALCSRIFDVDYDLICLRFVTDKLDGLPVVMDDDSKTLDYYGLCDGAEIFVDEIDVQARALDTKKNDEGLEKRMMKMDQTITAMQNIRGRR
mmetsp:Transcript_54033/g.61509  ORF Transcript_54033/g.61509 Transcript_54033/m.61509 type:complete len:595 (-) Transcript_54033:297-2081(-)